jgi:hypothetical protein
MLGEGSNLYLSHRQLEKRGKYPSPGIIREKVAEGRMRAENIQPMIRNPTEYTEEN